MMNRLKKYFIAGLVVFVPMAVTIYSFFLAINFADGLLGKYLEPYFAESFGFYFSGISILVGVYIIIVIGFFVTNFFGQKIYGLVERLFIKLPFFKQVYPAIKEMAIFLFSREQLKQFRQVVIIEYPRKGIYSFGFLTNETSKKITEKVRRDLCNLFIPSSPSPLTGFTVMVPKKDIIFLDITVEEAFKFILSGGVVNPRDY